MKLLKHDRQPSYGGIGMMKVVLTMLVLAIIAGPTVETRLAYSTEPFTSTQQIPFDAIIVYNDHLTINYPGLRYAKVTSNSMAPIITDTSTALERIPTSPDEIHTGDIISFYEPSVDGVVLHLVTEVLTKDGTTHYKTKGVANPEEDPWEVPYENVKGILVGVIK
ncbi:hypothetical protein HY489_05270 [Candidatus Woesearchaeota archaeon]|nr:hypothetical protein [Candidatus Woesearchaeota archaeon]